MKGKQIDDNSISKTKLNLVNPTIDKDPMTRGYTKSSYIQYTSLTDFRLTAKALVSDKINVNDFIYKYDSSDTTSADNGTTVIRTSDGAVYKKVYTGTDPADIANLPVSALQRTAINEKLSYGTIAQFTSVFDSTLDAYHVTDTNKEGLFKYDASDITSAQDGILVLVKAGKRYKRQHNGVFYPEWWGVDNKGLTHTLTTLQAAITSAGINNAELQLNGRYLLTSGQLNVTCNISGFGTINTRTSAVLNIDKSYITVKDITIDGDLAGTASGRGLYANYKDRFTIDNVKVRNVVSQGFWIRGCSYFKVVNCTTDNTRGVNGDGIYFRECVRPIISNNHCTNFERIGIAGEGLANFPTYDPIVTNNTCSPAIQTSDSINYPNAGIWLENTAGATITGNITDNTFARGIVCTPSIDLGTTHEYIVSNNKISGTDVGFAFSYPGNQVITVEGNIFTDCKLQIEIGDCNKALLSNNTFNRKNQDVSWFTSIIKWDPSAVSGKRTDLTITNCINSINNPASLPILISNITNQKGSLTISDCVGNFAYLLNDKQITSGDFKITNTLMDWSFLNTGTNRYIVNNIGVTSFINCTLILPNYQVFSYSDELNITNCVVNCSVPMRITLYNGGSRIIRITDSRFNNVRFFDVRRANHEIYLKDSSFDGYHVSQGLFEGTVTLVSLLEVNGCVFSRTIASTPIQFANSVTTSSLGNNTYFTSSLYVGFTPQTISTSFAKGTSAQRPTVTQIGYKYYDTTINKMIIWNGTEWIGNPSNVTVASVTTAPIKSALNTTYGLYMERTRVRYPDITGGARDYEKLTNSATSDWVETIWSTGAKTIIS